MRRVGRPKGTKRERKDIYANEFKILLEYLKENQNLNERVRSNAIKAFFLLYYFGFRVGELTLLRVEDLKSMVKHRVISLPNRTKGRTPRDAYISYEHVGILEEVFCLELGEPSYNSVLKPWGKPREQYSPTVLTRTLNAILHDVLGDQYSTHSFRAGYITQLHENGYDIAVLQEIMKHKNISTTQKYITISEKRKREAVESISSVYL